MIKNNLNIAQQVNCSGISSSLFLFFDSKILCRGSAPGVSPEVGGQDPQALPFLVLTTTGDKGTPSGATFTCPKFPAKHCWVLWGRAAWQLPQNLSELKRKNRIEEITNPLQAIKTGWSTRKERWKPRPDWSQPPTKWVWSQILVFSGLDWLSERVQRSCNFSYHSP